MRTTATTLRLRQYAPLGGPLGIIPDLGITLVSGPDGGTLQATISTVVAWTLPDDCEVAVEIYDEIAGQWVEGNDSRFVLLTSDADDRDPAGAQTLTGISLPVWLANKAALASQVPYSDAGNVEPAASATGLSVSGTTFTWGSHILGVGDRVKVTNTGKSKGLSKGAVYYVRNPTSSTFQLSHTPTGAIKRFGSSHSVGLSRVRTRIINLAGHQFAKNMAISVWDAVSNQALTNGSKYYVVNPTATSIQVATKPGGIPVELIPDSLIVYRYIDGQRFWKNAPPGNVISTAFMEARGRGWGQDGSGNDQVFHSWTVAADSNSLAWPARVDDPTVAGVSIGFQPGTSLWAMIQFLTTNGWAEFGSQGRTFNLYAPNTGNDYSTGASPKRVGAGAQQVQIHKDLTDYRTTEIVRGEGPIEQIVKGSRSPWGVLEVYATASGVTTASHAKSYGQADITKYSKPQTGYTATEQAALAEVLPIFDYQRGDWVQVLVKGVPTRLRVTQWTLTKAADGTLSISTLLEYRKRSVLHKVAAAAKKANGGRMVTSTSTTPAEIDKRKAAQPVSLAVAARPTYAADKSARGTVTASWLPVTSDTEGDDLVGEQYEVVVRVDGEQEGKVLAVTKNTTVDLPALPSGQTVAVAVRAISSTGEAGELSPEVEYVVDGAPDLPDAPSTPILTSTLGSVVIAWDGNLIDAVDGAIPAGAGFAFVQVQRSADNGTTWVTEAQTLPAAGSVTDLGLTVGSAYQYRLLAVDSLGQVSAPSTTATTTVVAVATAQINADFTQQVTTAASNASAAQTAASNAQTTASNASTAASNAQTAASNASTAASNAQTTANSKNGITYSTSAASGTPTKDGDLWWRVDSTTGAVTGWWLGSGGAWVAQALAATVIPNLDAGKITTGYLAAGRIAAATITGTMIAGTTITAGNLAANTITAGQIAANTITAGQIAANTITAGQLAANTITAAQLSATAIDAMTITGATFRTASTAKTSGGVQIDSTGLHGYNASGVATFSLGTDGALSVTGASVSGSITATSGSITGTLTVTGTLDFGATGVLTSSSGTYTTTLNAGYITLTDTSSANIRTTLAPSGFNINPSGNGSTAQLFMRLTGTQGASIGSSNDAALSAGGQVSMTATGNATVSSSINTTGAGVTNLYGGGATVAAAADIMLSNDGSPRVSSQAILNRTYAGVSASPGGSGSTNGFVVITSAGTLGVSNGYVQVPDAYSRVVSTRAAYLTNLGTFGTTSSSRRTKNLHRHIKMDDRALDAWLGLPTWEFEYKAGLHADGDPGLQHGLVAEEVAEAGFDRLIYLDEREGPTKGQIDGFAYERMGVYNRMAIQRLYARLMQAEKQIEALTRKAA